MADIIRLDSKGLAEHAAGERLEYLGTLLPSTPAPLTDEDLAIFGMFLQQDAIKFDLFMRASHGDYVPIFYAEVEKAIDKVIAEYAT